MIKKILITLVFIFVYNIVYAEQKIVKTIITVSPGGGVDVSTRHFEKWLLEKKNINLNFIFRPGAESIIGTTEIANSPKDGSVVGFTTIGALAAITEKNKNIEFDLISSTRKYAAVLVVNPKSGITDYNDYVKKSQAGSDFKLGQGSANQRMQMDYLVTTIKPKIDPVIVPYKGGGPVVNDILAGHIDVALLPYALVNDHISSNKLRIVASTSKLVDHPNVTILTKKYKDFPDYGGYCMIMPKNSDTKVVQFWRQTLDEYLSDAKVREEFQNEASEAYPAGEKFLKGMVKEIQTRFSE